MCEEVFNVIRRWQSDERLTTLSEARICSAVIVPILRGLDWDIANPEEVWEQYPVEDIGTVDYALLIGNEPKVLVEVKRGGESLERRQIQNQIRNYARIGGVSLAILTNGATWRFYLPLQEGSWERARVGDVAFHDENAAENTQTLVDLLSRENVSSEDAIRNAENLQEKNRILGALPNAWEKLVNEIIPNLLAETTQGLCGHRPDRSTVNEFLSTHLQQVSMTPPPANREATIASDPTPQQDSSGTSERTTCRAFTFCGNRHEVESWRDMLVKLCEIIHTSHRNRFDEVLNLRGNNPYFSRNPSDLPEPRQIDGTDIFVDVRYVVRIERIAKRLITHFGYDESDLSYETRGL